MSFKKVMCAALATALVGAFAASASASDKKMSINLGHVAIETTPIGRGTEYFAQIVNEKTNGRITVSVFPNSQLGGNREMIEQLQMGTLQFCSPSNAFLGGFTDKTALFDLPYLFTSEEGASRSSTARLAPPFWTTWRAQASRVSAGSRWAGVTSPATRKCIPRPIWRA